MATLLPGSVWAQHIYVHPGKGNDAGNGSSPQQAVQSLQRAVSLAVPGTVIHLMPTETAWHDFLFFHDRSGTPGKPIIVEGNGVRLSGSVPVNPQEWEHLGNGLYRNDTLFRQLRANMDIVRRYFFLFDGKMERMGRCLKGHNEPFRDPAELKPFEWTFVQAEGAFYLKTDPARTLQELDIKIPVRPTGVQFSGKVHDVIVRNIKCENFYNDGFGITGQVHRVRFEQIQAWYNGDDGISAHADCAFHVEGFISAGNGTGICDTGNSFTTYNNVLIRDCAGVDVYFLNEKPERPAYHALRNALVYCAAFRPVILEATHPAAGLGILMENVQFLAKEHGDRQVRIAGNVDLKTSRLGAGGLAFSRPEQAAAADGAFDAGWLATLEAPWGHLFREAFEKMKDSISIP
ncbi:hypothetical protein DLD77_00790 [Chitinophaga alhagiae]|uniref:Right-handed parallel beta-helix repeat-containing protein n=2 Tax=Chitinophaga alhagiae TaxID=2203219 RepID=A0ABM6W905_9BACT|nr:hypothetical protein [Chitinophaga alhagiae]AWO00344.1 hypothetical protein DLD77_00790 [Chitinophaga alhagiae]